MDDEYRRYKLAGRIGNPFYILDSHFRENDNREGLERVFS